MQKQQTKTVLPRFIRMRDAPYYLGMDKNRFNTEVRPSLTEIPIGSQGIAFDRHQLDAWADEYILSLGNVQEKNKEKTTWQRKSQDSFSVVVTGISTKSSKESEFAKALALTVSRKRKPT